MITTHENRLEDALYRTSVVYMALLLTLLTGGCASAGSGGAATSQLPTTTAAKADQNRITQAEIQAAGLPNAYELVSRLRRPWLRRDPRTGAEVTVYMDEQNIGGAEKLKEIPAVEVSELHFVSNDDAIQRWGPSVKGSVIVVVRRR